MCGISGYSVSTNAPFQGIDLGISYLTLGHRGPDDFGQFYSQDNKVGLAHNRLSIQDVSSLGHQPMASVDERVVIIFNGEIYNFKELRAELQCAGYVFKGNSDTEVLLALYLHQKFMVDGMSKMLRRLNGIFALAIWDLDLQSIFVARDAFGVKPLYYSLSHEGFFFASEIKGLLPILPSGRIEDAEYGNLDIPALNRYLSFLWCPGEGTPDLRVKKMGPGEAFWVKNGLISEHLKWYFPPSYGGSFDNENNRNPSLFCNTHVMSQKGAIVGLESHLRQAVHRQMISDVPLGAFLSGGLDSSSVVAFAREKNPGITCFTIETTGNLEEGVADDLPYARKVAAHLNVPLEVLRINSSDVAGGLIEMVRQLDEPLADPAALNVFYISRLARESGIKVLLSGVGGDDLFTGYRRHRALMSEKYWRWLPRQVLSKMETFSGDLDQRRPFGRRISKLFNGATLSGDEKIANYFRWSNKKEVNNLFTPEFRSRLGESKAEDPMLEFLALLPSTLSPIERMLALEQRYFLADHNLIYTDKMSMAVGVEIRVPFLDLELVEFAHNIPSKFKQRGHEGKWVLKKAMESYLPSEIIYRPKSGFGLPLRHWMRFELRDMMAEVLSNKSLRNRGLFDHQAVQCLVSKNDKGVVDASYTLFSLVCIELWCRQFVDKNY